MIQIRCDYCGNIIQPGQRFCPNCGKEAPQMPQMGQQVPIQQSSTMPPPRQMSQPPMGQMNQPMPMGPSPYHYPSPMPPKKKSKGWLVLLIVLLILAALGGGGYAVYKYYIKPKYDEAVNKTKSWLDDDDDDIDSFSTNRDDRDYSTEQQQTENKKSTDIPQGLNNDNANEPFGMTDEEAAQLTRAQREAALLKAQQARREAERKAQREAERKAQREAERRAQQARRKAQQQQYYDEPFGMTDEEAAQLTPAQRRELARRAARIRQRNGQR